VGPHEHSLALLRFRGLPQGVAGPALSVFAIACGAAARPRFTYATAYAGTCDALKGALRDHAGACVERVQNRPNLHVRPFPSPCRADVTLV